MSEHNSVRVSLQLPAKDEEGFRLSIEAVLPGRPLVGEIMFLKSRYMPTEHIREDCKEYEKLVQQCLSNCRGRFKVASLYWHIAVSSLGHPTTHNHLIVHLDYLDEGIISQ